MFKNEFVRFFAIGFAAGALLIGGVVAHAQVPGAPIAVLSPASPR